MNDEILEEMSAARCERRPVNLPPYITEGPNCGIPLSCAIALIYAKLVNEA
jgi:hypothetical protein